jgi:DNA-binding response OmpR family regulator
MTSTKASVNKSILLLLDEPVLADLTEFRLQLLGYQLRRAKSGDNALAELSKELPGLLILDTQVDGSDGLKWLGKLRMVYPPTQLPVMIFSLDPSLDTVQRAFHAGAQDYLITPFDPIVMEIKIKAFVGNGISRSVELQR